MSYNNWIVLAEDFLRTSQSILKMMVSTKNKWVVVKDYDNSLGDLDENSRLEIISDRYRNDTEWSDFNTLVPALFLLLHGLELSAKGLLAYHNRSVTSHHDLLSILEELKEIELMDKDLIAKIYDLLGHDKLDSIMYKFISANETVHAERVHIDIRYPFQIRNSTPIDFEMFKYNEVELIPEVKLIIDSIESFYCDYLKYIRGE